MRHFLPRATVFFLSFMLLAVASQAQAKKPVAKPRPVAAAAKPVAPKAIPMAASVASGKALYAQYCLTCHMATGAGVPNLNPPLRSTEYVLGDKLKLAGVILRGLSHTQIDGEDYHNAMPPFNQLTDQQIADILTYVRNSFGNKATAVTAAEVSKAR